MMAESLIACRQALAKLQAAVEEGRWQHMAQCQQFYAEAFNALQRDWQGHNPSAAEIEQLRQLEHQQRRLKRLINQRRQEAQEQLDMVQQAQKRLERLRHALAPTEVV